MLPTLCLKESLCAGRGAAEDEEDAAACCTGDTTADTLAVARLLPLPPPLVSPVLDACFGVCGRHRCCRAGAVGAAAVAVLAAATASITGLLLLLLLLSLCCCSSVGSLISAGRCSSSSGMKGATTCTGLPGDAALPGSRCVLVATEELPEFPLKELTEPLLLVGV